MVQTTLGIAISLSGMLAVLNLSKDRLSLADWWMLGWLSAMAGTMLFFLIAFNAEGVTAFIASTVANSFIGSCSIFLYLYARAIAGEPSLRPHLHFLLPLGNCLLMVMVAVGPGVSVIKGAVTVPAGIAVGTILAALPPLYLAVNAIYCGLAIRAIDRRKRRARELGASWADRRDLLWVRRWAQASLVILCGFGIIYLLSLFNRIQVMDHLSIAFLLQTALIIYVGYSGLRDTRFFRPSAGQPTIPHRVSDAGIPDWETIDQMLRDHAVWSDPHVTPEDASRHAGLSRDQLLSAIAKHGSMTFFELMNRYRVEQSMRGLTDPAWANLSVLQIGLDSGFGSKSAFYAAFQKEVGVTPAAFRKAHRPRS